MKRRLWSKFITINIISKRDWGMEEGGIEAEGVGKRYPVQLEFNKKWRRNGDLPRKGEFRPCKEGRRVLR